ncbi:MAG: hypothetical protein ILNGONEN_00595 [Syntrophorhabdaceae bacterium]|nr:hypothetical protein [Syntrophorhabdaceae bacterium]
MKLKTVEINEFQSIRKSNPFQIGDITCLVGKNEAGKTTILQALYRINPIIPSDAKFDVTDHYPRADVEDYQQEVENGSRKHAIVVKATFLLEEQDIKKLESDFSIGVLNEPKLTLSKGYENLLYINLDINEKLIVDSFLKKAPLPEDLLDEFSECSTLNSLIDVLKSKGNNTEHSKQLKNILDEVQKDGGIVSYIYDKYIKASVPKFLYFDEYYQMLGHENIEALKNRVSNKNFKKSDYPILGLIELARLDINALINPDRTEWLINKLEGASNHLSKKVLKYWSQNKYLQMKFDVRPARPGDPADMRSGTNLWARVYDSHHMVTTPLGTRSRGFVWFFSFLAWFDQQQRKQVPLILLLDEPGLFLHGKAQEDLLRYIEDELKGNHQVIYTTHSPFMVDPRKFDRVRIVQDKSMDSDEILPAEEEGTKVLSDILDATEDSLFPLQGALGYEIHQTLFIGPNNLVVEGISDLLYIQTISGILEKQGRTGLSPKWTITPVGGADKVPTFVALLGAQRGIKVATLIDIQKKDQQLIENLYKRKLLKKKNVITYGDFTNTSESDIEDMFSPGFYLALINSEYASNLDAPIEEKAITNKSPRILVRLEEYFAENPIKNSVQFSHYRPARYFAENAATLKSNIPSETLERFEIAFKTLNGLL